MEKIWLDQYPKGVPHVIDLDPQESLVDVLDTACSRFASLPAYTNFGRTMTYAQLDDMSARFAGYLQTHAGLERGDRVAIMMPNLLQYPVALFGILRAGMVIVNVNPLYTSHELEHQLSDSGAKAIVIAANSAATLDRIRGKTAIEHVVVTEIGDLLGFPRRTIVNFAVRYVKRMVPAYQLNDAVSFRNVLLTSRSAFKPETMTGSDLACLQYTGGTTGRAKGAMLSHGNLVANVRQVNTWFGNVVEEATEIIITALPLYHVYALTCNCLCYLCLGAHNILITDPRDTAGFVSELKKWPFTAITGVNTLYQSLVNHRPFAEVDVSALKLASAGGMAAMKDTATQWFDLTGVEILEGYGLSETSPVVTSNPPELHGFNGSIGLPLPNTEISLRNDQGDEVPLNEPGELCVRGPQVMAGYWNDPDATANTKTADGFLKTGDIATVDEKGFFRIVDRKKDMIIVSGFNVYPNEVEEVVTLHPDVMEAACVGVRGPKNREVVKVFVVARPGAMLTTQEIRDYCRENLAAYKVPKLVEFRHELPKSAVGKILRRELRDAATVPDSKN
jgi:long-chain acyl-CoA synthetase